MSLTFAYKDHQGKALGLIKLMREIGWQPSQNPSLFLMDFDGPIFYRGLLGEYINRGSVAALYPHGAVSHLAWDGLHPVSPEVSGYLAQAPGPARVMMLYGYPHPIFITGWHWCTIQPMRPMPRDPKRILFAPIHPLGNGFMAPLHADANRRAFADLLEHFEPHQIAVRSIGEPEACGLDVRAGVHYHQGNLMLGTADILLSDIVVSSGTFAHLALACGVPTIMFGQDYPLGDGESQEEWRQVQHWDLYADYMRYPVERCMDLDTPLVRIEAWREIFIGRQATTTSVGQALQGLMANALTKQREVA